MALQTETFATQANLAIHAEMRRIAENQECQFQSVIEEQYSGQILGYLFVNDAIITKGFVIRARFV